MPRSGRSALCIAVLLPGLLPGSTHGKRTEVTLEFSIEGIAGNGSGKTQAEALTTGIDVDTEGNVVAIEHDTVNRLVTLAAAHYSGAVGV